ncbi:pseudaminic acid cytidylyltransferase [Bowmanella dokdonensis]|uniref:Pseudaminic acid cytidylyltransferase n=1 Tax=Bowmanella dokdonensis TaxID=751969 RepID=A0A939DP36_9ALTE|nr:pseudaminic acid cytidylyltransferase [Bowmanella dokdonensis]MBN7826353.1 pseudaminic acid cytidylyltransferase [Bowmanella dokdonensis]
MKIAVIPARGGSKRIPGKNIKPFCGKPLIAYSIEVARQTGLFDRVLVSTDSEAVAEIARQYGAEVPFVRPTELADDHTGTSPVVRHAIRYCQEQGQAIELTCCLYATAPLLQPFSLLEGLQKLEQYPDKAFAFSVSSFAFPIQRALREIPRGGVEPIYPEHIGKRSQDLEEAYHDAGQFYWGRTEAWLSAKPMFAEHSMPVVLPRYLVQDIDTPEDWQRAELLYKAFIKEKNL